MYAFWAQYRGNPGTCALLELYCGKQPSYRPPIVDNIRQMLRISKYAFASRDLKEHVTNGSQCDSCLYVATRMTGTHI